MDAGPLHANPLGQLLVDRGLMSQEQLEDALLEQRVSRKRLGSILVGSRTVTPQDLTSALQAQISVAEADQQAGLRDEQPSPAETASKRRLFRRQRQAENGVAVAAPGSGRLRDLLEITEGQNDALRQEFARQTAELELARAELVRREARIAELETHLRSVEQERSLLAGGLRAEIRELESDLRALRSNGTAELRTPPAPAQIAPAARETYLMLTPGDAGDHALREAVGAPPPIGGEVEIAGRRFRVVSHRRSPLGVDDRVCVHLQPA